MERFLLTCPVAMQLFWSKQNCLQKKGVQLSQDCFGAPTCMAAVSLFWKTNMAAMTSYENALLRPIGKRKTARNVFENRKTTQ